MAQSWTPIQQRADPAGADLRGSGLLASTEADPHRQPPLVFAGEVRLETCLAVPRAVSTCCRGDCAEALPSSPLTISATPSAPLQMAVTLTFAGVFVVKVGRMAGQLLPRSA